MVGPYKTREDAERWAAKYEALARQATDTAARTEWAPAKAVAAEDARFYARKASTIREQLAATVQ